MADYSFLRFVKDFQQAINNENFPNADLLEDRIIVQKPNETFVQITNCTEDIAFAGNLLAELVDYRNLTVYTFIVGGNFFYEEFTNVVTGIKQIAYEFGNVGQDFYKKRLFLKLSQPGISNNVWYSAPMCVTNYETDKRSKFFQYKHQGYFRGISYDIKDYFQTARAFCYNSDLDFKIENQGYTELSGDEVSYRQIITKKQKGKFVKCNNFTLERVATLFAHDILYVDGYRCNNKPAIKKGDKKGNAGFFDLDFEYNPSGQYLPTAYQVYKPLVALDKLPSGIYSLNTYNTATSTSTLFSVIFNKVITIAADIELLIYKDAVLFATVAASKFSVAGNTLNIDVSASPISTLADYSLFIAPGKILCGTESFEGFNFGEWDFTIAAGEYVNTEYSNTEYLTN